MSSGKWLGLNVLKQMTTKYTDIYIIGLSGVNEDPILVHFPLSFLSNPCRSHLIWNQSMICQPLKAI